MPPKNSRRWIFLAIRSAAPAIGEPKEVCLQMVAKMPCVIYPNDKPRYLMGVGSLDYILTGISLGVDMFDCVLADPDCPAWGLNDLARSN
jgi:tRNA-guanine family transglycosylase